MIEKKKTRKEMFEAIKIGCTTGEWTVSNVEVAEFCDKEIGALERKAAKAKETAQKKRAEEDELIGIVADALTEDFMTISKITEKINEVGIETTSSKVGYRLNALVEQGKAEKQEITVKSEGQKSRKLMAYRLIQD